MPERRNIKSTAVETWVRADQEWERGRLRPAFRLMLAAAKMRESGAQVTVGYMYDNGVGTKTTSKRPSIGTSGPTVEAKVQRLIISAQFGAMTGISRGPCTGSSEHYS
jgi:hypothetical protein